MIGTQLLHFKITGKLGEGGMGEVYRASDTRLGREVAIKILPAAFTADKERLARFEREARALASLAHPNVAAIHDVGQADGVHFLVMELAEGQTLQERLRSGPFTGDQALAIVAQIAGGLEAAHAKGIVHRDLKPANVVLAENGRVKLLDFGLAKALQGEPDPDRDLSLSPTMTAQATMAGVILGTAAYMSPEQARGKPVNERADIWAFGLLLYEMLAGSSPFTEDTVTETMAAVLRADIDWDALPPRTPGSLKNLLKRCLERDPERRLHSIADARIVVEELIEAGPEAWSREEEGASRRALWPWLAAAFVAGAAVATGGFLFRGEVAEPSADARPLGSFRALTLLPGGETQPAISPDGESFAYVKMVDGQQDIFLQRVDGQNRINLTRNCAEDDTEPRFSFDGRRIAFRSECSGGGIFMMGATGESVRKVTDFGFSPTWSPAGDELAVVTEQPYLPWGRTTESKLWAVQVETGERRLVSEHDAMHPDWSPDGRRIAFWGLARDSSDRHILTVAADGSQPAVEQAVHVTDDRPLDWNPVWWNEGRSIIFSSTRGGTFNLWSIRVDPGSGRSAGEPEPLTVPSSWAGWLSVSRDGRRLVYADRNARDSVFRVPIDPAGNLGGPPEPVAIGSFEVSDKISPSLDGRSLLFANTGLPQHLVIINTDGEVRRLTDGPHRDRQGFWSPDEQWIAFQTDRFDDSLALIRADGSGLRRVGPTGSMWHPRWSPDGSRIAYDTQQGGYVIDVRAEADGRIEKLPDPPDGLMFGPGSFSPDGKRLAGHLDSEVGVVGAAVLTLASGEYRRLPAERVFDHPLFLGDGRHIVWSEPDRLVLHDVETGKTRALLAATAGRTLQSISISHDRRWLVYLEVADESDIWLASFD